VHDPLSNVGAGLGLSRSTSRSTRGPPSSYHRRHAHGGGGGHGSDEDGAGGAGRSVGEDWTAAEIRTEIINIQEEMHRVGDMFRGLEVSRLVKAGVVGPGRTVENEEEGTWTVVSGSGSRYYANGGGPPGVRDGVDVAGGGGSTATTTGSVKRRSGVFASKLGRKGSLSFLKRPPPPLPPLPTPTPTVHSQALPAAHPHPSYLRSSGHVPTLMSSPAPPTPITPITAVTPSDAPGLTTGDPPPHPHPHPVPNLVSSRSSPHLPLARGAGVNGASTERDSSARGAGVGVGGVVGPERQVETDIEEVRRKRADVEVRYERRLEYLRARLKAAEIRERVLR
jgi:hypothetical protein